MKIIENTRKAVNWIRLAITQPREQLTSMQKKIRNGVEVLTYCARHLKEDRAPVLSAALAFRTLFGLLPVLVVATVTARALLGENFAKAVGSVLKDLGLSSITIGAKNSSTGPTDLATWLQNIVEDASKVNLAALGWVGFAVVTFSAIWLLVAIEGGFNTIYRAPNGRSWPKRVVVYWFLLTCGPLLMVGMPWLNSHFSELLTHLPKSGWLASIIDVISGLFVFWIFMLMAYLWVPNTRVRFRPAMIGALVAAILLETGKRLLGLYTSNALTLNQLYGSLGLIPLFMFWVYMMWMFVLFGLEVSSIVQVLRGRSPAVLSVGEGVPGLVEPAILLRVVKEASANFDSGTPVEAEDVSNQLGLNIEMTRTILDRLADCGILRRLENSGQFAISRPPDRIDAAEVLAVGFKLADESTRSTPPPILSRLRTAQASLLKGVTIETAIGPDNT